MYLRHAYCIIAHNEPDIFQKLISLLDFPYNDIFVHVDKAVNIEPFKKATCHSSHITFLQNRRRCRWGTLDMVKVELDLLQEACEFHQYNYYHILSGVDLPIKTQGFLHSILDSNSQNYNYIGFVDNRLCKDAIVFRTSFYHFLIRRPGDGIISSFLSFINTLSIKIQKRIGVKRTFPFALYKGAVWMSITDSFCHFLINNRDSLLHDFRWTRCTDEIVLQSAFMASPFKESLHNPTADEYSQCMREIDWNRGTPYSWKNEDFDYLMSSNKWFARKFSSDDMEVVNNIYSTLKKSEKQLTNKDGFELL